MGGGCGRHDRALEIWGHWPSSGPSTGTTRGGGLGVTTGWKARSNGGRLWHEPLGLRLRPFLWRGRGRGLRARKSALPRRMRLAISSPRRAACTLWEPALPADPVLARQHLVQAAELARTAQDQWCLADALRCVGYTHLAEGDHRLAAPFLEEAFPIWDRRGNQFQRGWHHGGMAWAAASRGQMPAAETEIRKAIEIARTVGDPTLEVWACALLCSILVAAGRPQAMAAEMETLLRVRTNGAAWAGADPHLLGASPSAAGPGRGGGRARARRGRAH